MTPRRVSYPGLGTLWFHDQGDGTGPLVPKEYCNDDGRLLPRMPWCYSVAYVWHDGFVRKGLAVLGPTWKLELIAPDAFRRQVVHSPIGG